LIGAYQEVMGSFHNLFGTPNEAIVVVDKKGGYHLSRITSGSQVADMLTFARYEKDFLHDSFRTLLERQMKKGRLTVEEADRLWAEYESHYTGYTYLESNGQKSSGIGL
jgi:arginine decarboxylase